MVFAVELVEMEELQERFRKADEAAEYAPDRLRRLPTPEVVLGSYVATLETHGKKHRTLLRGALKEARRPRRAKQHWSGLSRKTIGRELAKEHPDIKLVYEVGDNFYGYLSVNTHPRLRLLIEPRSIARNGAVVIHERMVDQTLPLDLASAAMVLAVAGLTWSGRRFKVYVSVDGA